MKNGLKAFDSDMHVYDPAFLYEKYMNPQWGERIPRGQRNGKHGRVEFSIGAGKETLRGISAVIDHGQKQVADRYDFAVARDYDAVSQIEAMDREGLDVAVLFRTSPLHCDETLEPDYANDLCKAWNDWITDFCKENPQRLRASALITLHDVDLAVEEVRRAVRDLKVTGAVALSRADQRQDAFTIVISIRSGRRSKSSGSRCASIRRRGRNRIKLRISSSAIPTPTSSRWLCAIRWS